MAIATLAQETARLPEAAAHLSPAASTVELVQAPVHEHGDSLDSLHSAAIVTARRAVYTLDPELWQKAQALNLDACHTHIRDHASTLDKKEAAAISREQRKRQSEANTELKKTLSVLNRYRSLRESIYKGADHGRYRCADFDKLREKSALLFQDVKAVYTSLPQLDSDAEKAQHYAFSHRKAKIFSEICHAEARSSAKQRVKTVLESIDKVGWGPLRKAVEALVDLKELGVIACSDDAVAKKNDDKLYRNLYRQIFVQRKGAGVNTSSVTIMVSWLLKRLSAEAEYDDIPAVEKKYLARNLDQALDDYREYERGMVGLQTRLAIATTADWKKVVPYRHHELNEMRKKLVM